MRRQGDWKERKDGRKGRKEEWKNGKISMRSIRREGKEGISSILPPIDRGLASLETFLPFFPEKCIVYF